MAFTTPIAGIAESLGSNGGTSSAMNTSGADLLVAAVTLALGGSVTLSDSKSNSWTAGPEASNGATTLRLYYSVPTSVGSGHTFTISGTSVFSSISVQAWAGAHTSPFDQENDNAADPVSSIQPGSVTPSDNGQLLVTAMHNSGDTSDASRSIDTSFATPYQKGLVGGASYAIASSYFVQSSAAAINPSWSWSTGATAGLAVIASFKASAGGGGGPVTAKIIFEKAA